MLLKISSDNLKIGKVPNLSLPPGKTCVPGIPCFTDGCYAQQSYLQYPNVRTAWELNLLFYTSCPIQFFKEFSGYVYDKEPKLFRLFVGGDFPDLKFYQMFESLCEMYPGTKFLVFTKRYDFDFSHKPENLQVILSIWPDYPLPNNKDLPWAWLEEDTRRPQGDFYRCPGGCTDCNHSCWNFISPEIPVVLPKH